MIVFNRSRFISFSPVTAAALVLLVASSAGAADASWAPFEARKRTILYELGADGNETIVERREGAILRSSSGVELQVEGRVVEGKTFRLEAGTLLDRTTGDMYQLLYDRKAARLLFRGKGPVSPPEKTAEYLNRAKELSLGDRVISGVACHDRPVLAMNVETPDLKKRIGTVCRSAEYDLPLKRVREQREASGRIVRTVEELYDIRIGVEPEVGVPADFEIVDDAPQPLVNVFCRSCGTR